MNFIRIITIFCLCHLLALYHAEREHHDGMLYCRLINLPHRGLGMLFNARVEFPGRQDFMLDYLMQWSIYDHDEWLLEGQKKPVIPMLAVSASREFPNNKPLQTMRDYFVNDWLKKQRKDKK